jgi:hypothetical protein
VVEPTLVAEIDVDQDKVGPKDRDQLPRLRARTCDPDDSDSLLLQHIAGRVQEVPVVVNDHHLQHHALRFDVHRTSVATRAHQRIEASTKSGLQLTPSEPWGLPLLTGRGRSAIVIVQCTWHRRTGDDVAGRGLLSSEGADNDTHT